MSRRWPKARLVSVRRLGNRAGAWLLVLLLNPSVGRACSVCFGAGTGDNPNSAGLNAGVGVLFAVLLPLQLLILLLFLRIARRSNALGVDQADSERGHS